MRFYTGNVEAVMDIFEHTECSADVAGVGVDQGSSKSIFDSKLSRCLFVCRTHKLCPILELILVRNFTDAVHSHLRQHPSHPAGLAKKPSSNLSVSQVKVQLLP
jgi:hypothetical protein